MEVFFRKDDPNPNDPTVPNWFYYWSQIPTANQNLLNIKFFDIDTKVWAVGPPVSLNLKYFNDGKYAFDENKVYSPDDQLTYGSCVVHTTMISKERIGPSSKGMGENIGGKYFRTDPFIKIGQGCGFEDIGDKNVTGIGVFIASL